MRVRSAESLLTQSELVTNSTPPLRNRMSKVCWMLALYNFTTWVAAKTHAKRLRKVKLSALRCQMGVGMNID